MLNINKRFNLLFTSMLMISGCKYNIYSNHDIYKLIGPIIHVHSDDPYGAITVMIKKKLRMYNMLYNGDYEEKIKHKKSSYVILYIMHTSEQYLKTALFQNGESAEYQLILNVTVKLEMSNNESYSFNVKTCKSFFNNPMIISQNFVKKNNIRQIIYEEASKELINRLYLLITK